MSKPDSSQPLPIQPVENPILCSPYQEPDQYWLYDSKTGVPSKAAVYARADEQDRDGFRAGGQE